MPTLEHFKESAKPFLRFSEENLQSMAAPGELQYFQSEPLNPMLMNTNYYSDVSMDTLTCHSELWNTWNAIANAGLCEVVEEHNSSSPTSPKLKSGAKDERRRSNNRASQRAYRDRKVHYVADLEQDVREIERKSQELQNENRKFVRELCEIRVNNKDLVSGCGGERRQREPSTFSKSPVSPAVRTGSPFKYHEVTASTSPPKRAKSESTDETDASSESLSETLDELRSTYANVNDNVLTEAMLETLIELIDNGINLTAPPSHPVQSSCGRRETKK